MIVFLIDLLSFERNWPEIVFYLLFLAFLHLLATLPISLTVYLQQFVDTFLDYHRLFEVFCKFCRILAAVCRAVGRGIIIYWKSSTFFNQERRVSVKVSSFRPVFLAISQFPPNTKPIHKSSPSTNTPISSTGRS